jgi:hypothetical protein
MDVMTGLFATAVRSGRSAKMLKQIRRGCLSRAADKTPVMPFWPMLTGRTFSSQNVILKKSYCQALYWEPMIRVALRSSETAPDTIHLQAGAPERPPSKRS